MRLWLGPLALVLALSATASADTRIRILHANDTHAHMEPTMIKGKAYGGWAKFATAVQRNWAQDEPCFLLHGGDAFQGTLFFNVYEGLADAAVMNAIGFDAMAVGNHEFDKGPAALARFASLAEFPLLAANLDMSQEPLLKELIAPHAVIESKGFRIGVVGACTEDLPFISSPGENVKVEKLVPSLQREIDLLAGQGVNVIVVVSHCGYDVEKDYATKLRGVDVVVGGHSHTLLGNVQFPNEQPVRGPYPTVMKNADGKTALVVQAWEWSKVLGKLQLVVDDAGNIVSWEGSEAIAIDDRFHEDRTIASMIGAFKKPIEALMAKPAGELKVELGRAGSDGDSPMGNFIADAMLAATKQQSTVAAFMNAGGVRASLPAGPVTFGQVIEVQPFANTLVVLEVSGAEIKQALENGAARLGLLAVSEGTSYRADRAMPENSRVSDVVIGGSPLELGKTYRIVTNSFIAAGGDAQTVLKDAKGYRFDTGLVDSDTLIEYLQARSPVSEAPPKRVVAVGS
ncbi:MAG: bifunctional UDP-sugar hydrolase/5'-nucleotidase [Fimbriimonadaceae bacterium]